MENNEFEKLIAFNIKDKLKYVSNSVEIKTIVYEKTGNIMALALDYGKTYKPQITPYSTFIKIIEGKAEVVIDDQSAYLQHEESIIIPGHTNYTIEANQRFKMLLIILKSGYDNVEL